MFDYVMVLVSIIVGLAMTHLMQGVVDIIQNPERMMKNLESTGGLIFSGQLLLELAEAGMSREDAYRLVQAHAMKERTMDDTPIRQVMDAYTVRSRMRISATTS